MGMASLGRSARSENAARHDPTFRLDEGSGEALVTAHPDFTSVPSAPINFTDRESDGFSGESAMKSRFIHQADEACLATQVREHQDRAYAELRCAVQTGAPWPPGTTPG